MYIKTVKIKSVLRAALTVLIIAAAVFAAIYALNRLLSPGGITLETEEQRLEFLHGLGWETSDSAINCREVVIPEEWSDVYERYNRLQLAQGFDLTKHRGKRRISSSRTENLSRRT